MGYARHVASNTASLVRDLAVGTVTVSPTRLDETVGIYRELFDWAVVSDELVTETLATSWGTSIGGRRCVVLGAAGEPRGLVRLVAGTSPPPPVLASYGWSSLEITVRDVDALAGRVARSPHFRINGDPKDLKFSDKPPGQRAMQAVGPAGEQLYLTQILQQTLGQELVVPPDGADVGNMFIAVLAARDYRQARAFYTDVLGMDAYIELNVQLSVATRAAGWPQGTTCLLSALKPIGETRIELDGYPALRTHPRSTAW